MSAKQTVLFTDLGIERYKPVWDLQEKLLAKTVGIKSAHFDESPFGRPTLHRLLFVEHPPVYTLGKSGHIENILISETDMQAKGIDYFKINRGGDITFHGPQQLVGYPIMDLEKFYTDIGKYLRALEEVIIRTIAQFGIAGERSPGETGVWIDAGVKGRERKICAMGVRTSRWVTMHGWALNVNTDLSYFENIIPCGIRGKEVTSMKRELGKPVNYEELKQVCLKEFAHVFEVDIVPENIAMAANLLAEKPSLFP
jgi:lipoyl(octanoyl) transferase